MKGSEEKIDYKYNVKEYLGYLKKYKFLIVILIFLVLIGELKQVLDRYLFKIIIDNGTEFTSGNLSLEVFKSLLIILAIVYITAIAINSIVNFFRLHYLNRLDANAIFDLKERYFGHLIKLDYNFHTTHKTGSLISRLSRGASAMERMNDSLILEFAPLILQFVVATLALMYLDYISAIVIFVTMIVFITFSVLMQRLSDPSNVSMNKTEDVEKGNMADFFTNIESIRNYGKEEYIKNRYKLLTLKTKKTQVINWDYWRYISTGQSLILTIGTFLLILFPILQFLKGNITLGTLTFIYTTYIGLIGPLFGFVNGIRNFSRSMADFQELFQYGKIKNSIKDKTISERLEIEKGEIEFKNVNFKYGKRKIFENFNLKIKPNEKVALVGHSGSGKTTLVRLLYRLYDVDSGDILIDGKSIKDVKQESLREDLSIVPQECVLFDDTIFNNIKFSNPKASTAQVMRAIKFAQLDKIIQSLPNKENTIVGERGVKLSGGEKQRVSIARAILANQKVLLLDEATSSLDSVTEFEIQKDLQKLLEGRTSIIIAHRLSTIMHADKIVVMKDGKIVQMGKHSDLIKQSGEYKRLWNLQKGGYIQ